MKKELTIAGRRTGVDGWPIALADQCSEERARGRRLPTGEPLANPASAYAPNPVCLRASPAIIAADMATLIDRWPSIMGIMTRASALSCT